jgi:hypothetical protein
MGMGLRRWVMAGAVLAATGCSSVVETGSGGAGEGSSGGAGEGSGSSDDLARLAAAICERQAACDCDEPYSDYDQDGCETLHYEGLQNYGAAAAQDADNYVFDAQCLRELADCWEQLECGQSYADAAACAPSCAIHRMNLGVGDDCYDSWVAVNPPGLLERCEPDLTCLGGHGYAVCDTPAPLQLGERCFDAGMHRHCAPDLYCAGQEEGSGECQPRLREGTACEARGACEVGLRCHEGVCGPLGQPGEDCSFDGDCDGDLRCHPIDDVCAARGEVGEVCRFPTDYGFEFLPCVDGAWCGEEVCEPTLEIGSACEYSDGCLTGSACVDGSCTDCAEGGCGGGYPLCSAIPHPAMYPRPLE